MGSNPIGVIAPASAGVFRAPGEACTAAEAWTGKSSAREFFASPLRASLG